MVLFFIVASFPGEAKSQISLELNSKVRIYAPTVVGGIVPGTLIRLDQDSLAVRVDNRVIVFPRSSIEKLWRVSGERGHALTGALIGLPAGAIAGLVFSKITCEPDPDESGLGLCTYVGILAGTGLGAITGGIIGSMTKSVSWQKVDVSKINLSLGVVHGRTAGLKFSWAF